MEDDDILLLALVGAGAFLFWKYLLPEIKASAAASAYSSAIGVKAPTGTEPAQTQLETTTDPGNVWNAIDSGAQNEAM